MPSKALGLQESWRMQTVEDVALTSKARRASMASCLCRCLKYKRSWLSLFFLTARSGSASDSPIQVGRDSKLQQPGGVAVQEQPKWLPSSEKTMAMQVRLASVSLHPLLSFSHFLFLLFAS